MVLALVKTFAIASLAVVAVANPFEFVVYQDGACNGPVADQRIDRPIGSCTNFQGGGLYGAYIFDIYNNMPGCTFKFWELADCHGKATVQHSSNYCTAIGNKDGQLYLTNGAKSTNILRDPICITAAMRAYATLYLLAAVTAVNADVCAIDICANNGGCTTLYPYIGQGGDFPGDYYNNLRHLKVTVGDTIIYRADGSFSSLREQRRMVPTAGELLDIDVLLEAPAFQAYKNQDIRQSLKM
ncbi:hypothetical protein V502_11481 [Pseudogymnoascus sp. VKM F-4520 (FW-2644)]|nr:hypothetical protein V502_11481 [Pseudogymnoascus sp. VKM F-4520 (FW-2644)]